MPRILIVFLLITASFNVLASKKNTYSPAICDTTKNLSCIDLGEIFRKKEKPRLATEVYSKGCTLGDLHACVFYGWYLYVQKQYSESLRIHTNTCEKGYTYACAYKAYILYTKFNRHDGFEEYKNACKRGDTDACTTVGRLVTNKDF